MQNEPNAVGRQYADSSNLGARATLHARFSTNRYGWHEWVFDQFDLGDTACILEVGCGPAWLWRSNVHRVPDAWRVVATDMSAGMVREAREAFDDGRFAFAIADVQALPFESGLFDAVVANHMLYHVPDLPSAVAELARVLVDGGRLYAATNGRHHLLELDRLVGREPLLNVRAFGLETGPASLEPAFADIEVVRYSDALRVTETEPLVDYIRSMETFWPDVEGEREEEIRRRVSATIEREGAFRIGKDAGLICAVRR